MSTLMKPMSNSASLRAAAADPNGRRCLIENCSTQKAIQLAHVFQQENSSNSKLMSSLEWNWGMKKNTLNLDTKGNTFFVGASLHELYKGRKWVLLPEESTVYQYFGANKIEPLSRTDHPIPEAPQYRYTMFPLQDMDDIYLTRQSMDPDTITVHDYPFEGLPVLTSHINPKYAILQVGSAVYKDVSIEKRRDLRKRYPILKKIDTLYTQWTATLSDVIVKRDTTFAPAPLASAMGQELPDRNSISSGDSVCTPPRRILPLRTSRAARASYKINSSASSSSRPRSISPHFTSSAAPVHMSRSHEVSSRKRPSDDGKAERERRKRKRLTLLTYEALEMLEDELEESDSEDDGGWSVERMLSWAQGCIVSPVTLEPDSESVPTKYPGSVKCDAAEKPT